MSGMIGHDGRQGGGEPVPWWETPQPPLSFDAHSGSPGGLLRLIPGIETLPGGVAQRLVAAAILFATSLATGVVGLTESVWTNTESVAGNTFSTGSVDISTSPTSAIVTMTGMKPADFDNGTVTVSNAGSLQLRYAIKSTTTEATLAAQLDMTIWEEAAEAVVDGTCDATAPASVLYGPADLGSTAGLNVVGDPTTGAQAGDRPLNALANEVLCFRVELPSSTNDTFQSLTSTATLDFIAEQT